MLLRCLFFLAFMVSAPLLSLSQESGKAKPRLPVTKTPEVVSKAGIIYVVGDVHKPMSVAMKATGALTVLKALAIAEGANPTASLHHAKIIRKSENGPTQVPVDIKEIFAGKAPDVTLQANDILFVPSVISNAAGKQHRQDFYDAPPPGPLQDPTPAYPR